MTVEQLKESYMFRIIKRALMKQYPWIKDVEIDEKDFDDYKTIIFLRAYIDPYELGEQMDWEVARWVTPGYDGGTTLSLFFKGNDPDYMELTDEVNEFIDEIYAKGEEIYQIPEVKRPTQPRGSKHALYVNRTYFGIYSMMADLNASIETKSYAWSGKLVDYWNEKIKG